MMKIRQRVKKIKKEIFLVSCPLVSIGLLSLYSSSIGRADFSNFYKQVFFFGCGLILMFLFSQIDWRFLKSDSRLILFLYFLCLLLLVGVFFFAPPIRGIKSWYKLGPFSLNPIEFTKIVLIILLAKYFSSHHRTLYRTKDIFKSLIYVILPSVLIFFQPDLGSILVILSIWLAMLIISGIRLRHFLIIVLCGLIIFAFAWSFLLKDYQKQRLVAFLNPNIDPQGTSWNLIQSKIAIGNGGLFGQGIGKGSQTQYGFLPEVQTDFIFAAIAEEFGLFGVSFLLFLYLILIWQILKIPLSDKGQVNNFLRLYTFGLATLFFSQAAINIGMNLGLLPIIGLPLPFVSYSGSNLLASYIGLGILMGLTSPQE
jgi:rod shape determining protein RodA